MRNPQYLSTLLRVKQAAPVLNRPDFERVFTELPLDDQGLLRAVEFVALPKTRFTVVKEVSPNIAQVETEDYPSNIPLYIDTRFTEIDPCAPARMRLLPSNESILARLESSLELPYIWGGNHGAGIPQIAELYPNPLPKDEALYFLRGVDCSGLLYEATQGYTPRNTSGLLNFGQKVSSIADVKPLDILVWPGHVIICLNRATVIESLLGHGVIVSSLQERIPAMPFEIRRFAKST